MPGDMETNRVFSLKALLDNGFTVSKFVSKTLNILETTWRQLIGLHAISSACVLSIARRQLRRIDHAPPLWNGPRKKSLRAAIPQARGKTGLAARESEFVGWGL
jgi:hypothetical protein